MAPLDPFDADQEPQAPGALGERGHGAPRPGDVAARRGGRSSVVHLHGTGAPRARRGGAIAVDDGHLDPGAARQPEADPLPVAAGRPRTGRQQVSTCLTVADALMLGALALALLGPSPVALAYVIVTTTLLWLAGRPGETVALSIADRLPAVVGTLSMPLVVVSPLVALGHQPLPLLWLALGALPAVFLGRSIAHVAIRAARRRGRLLTDTLVVGGGVVANDVARILMAHPEYGMRVVGQLDDDGDVDGVPHLGGVGRLDGVLAAKGVGNVVVAFSRTGEHRLIEVLRATTSQGVDVYVVPRFFDIAIAGVEASDLWGLPLQRLRQPGPLVRGWRLKRLFDLVVASALLLVASPVLAALAIAVKVSSPGPVLFRQRRLGLNARPFDLLKFRSLPVNGDSDTTWSVTTDPRIGRVGRFLRASSLDELPQLWNVLRGEMSLIGPRPERPHFAARFDAEIPHYPARLRVPPGLTGHAQVHGLRGDTSIEDRARFDNRYIERWSVWHDLAILLRTVGVVLRGHGDRR